jgi:hypothetical protein
VADISSQCGLTSVDCGVNASCFMLRNFLTFFTLMLDMSEDNVEGHCFLYMDVVRQFPNKSTFKKDCHTIFIV